jgi:hypothetical protein
MLSNRPKTVYSTVSVDLVSVMSFGRRFRVVARSRRFGSIRGPNTTVCGPPRNGSRPRSVGSKCRPVWWSGRQGYHPPPHLPAGGLVRLHPNFEPRSFPVSSWLSNSHSKRRGGIHGPSDRKVFPYSFILRMNAYRRSTSPERRPDCGTSSRATSRAIKSTRYSFCTLTDGVRLTEQNIQVRRILA